jgi:hypothetical protein
MFISLFVYTHTSYVHVHDIPLYMYIGLSLWMMIFDEGP